MKKKIIKENKVTAVALSTIMFLGISKPLAPLANTSLLSSTISILPEDIDGNGKVDIIDLSKVANLYNSKIGDSNYKAQIDLTNDGLIDLFDLTMVAKKFTTSTDTTAPADFQISKDNWDGSPDYSITMNLWFGTNGDIWRLYENDILIAEIPLVNNSPNVQTATYKFTDKMNGTYIYTSELVNSVGVTKAKNSVTQDVTKNDKLPDLDIPSTVSGEPAVGYKIVNENETSFEWLVYLSNPNINYVWEGKEFSTWGLTFDTENQITSVSDCDSFTQVGNKVTINTKTYERLLPSNTTRIFRVKGSKKTSTPPSNFKANLFRGPIYYPEFENLPSTWSKNKADLSLKDLIVNESDYYSTTVKGNTGNMLMYSNPAHKTQVQLGMPKKMPMQINGFDNSRIWIPNPYIAMGVATGTEYFGLNPNFMIGLSVKENSTCLLVDPYYGNAGDTVTIDGIDYIWPTQKTHVDGPFQQEAGNFNEIKKQYPDYISNDAKHEDYVTLKTGNADDSGYVSAAFSSYISLTMTRELLYAIPNNDFAGIVRDSKDPWAEFIFVDNAYNRGVYGLLQKNLFTTHRQEVLNSSDIGKDFELSGFASHVENVRNVLTEMDKETNLIYDAEISWPMMEEYLKQLKKFYDNGVPNDTEWVAMTEDVKRAYNLLSQHWGGTHVSFRYDFLTLLRVATQYLPENKQPAPSSQSWIDQIVSANNQAAAAPKTMRDLIVKE